MAIYESYKKYLVEADDDDNADGGQNVDVGSDNADTGGDDQNADQNQDNADNAGDENADTNNDDQNQDDNNDDDGYDINADDNAGNDNDTTTDTTTDDTTGDDDTGGTDDEESPEVENPGLDKIYERMSPAEKSHHDHELRQQYKKIFRLINILIEKTVALPRTSQTIDTTTNLLHTLFAFKKYMIFYIEKKYESKTLIENKIEYWKYVSILNSYKAIYKELNKILVHEEDNED